MTDSSLQTHDLCLLLDTPDAKERREREIEGGESSSYIECTWRTQRMSGREVEEG